MWYPTEWYHCSSLVGYFYRKINSFDLLKDIAWGRNMYHFYDLWKLKTDLAWCNLANSVSSSGHKYLVLAKNNYKLFYIQKGNQTVLLYRLKLGKQNQKQQQKDWWPQNVLNLLQKEYKEHRRKQLRGRREAELAHEAGNQDEWGSKGAATHAAQIVWILEASNNQTRMKNLKLIVDMNYAYSNPQQS